MKKWIFTFFSFLLISFLFFFPVSAVEEQTDVSELISGAVSGVLMEANSGKIIFSKEADKEVAVASMTKMVAQILILDAIRNEKIYWDDIVTVSKTASDMGGSQIYLSVGEKISIRDLFKGISMASANDVVVVKKQLQVIREEITI